MKKNIKSKIFNEKEIAIFLTLYFILNALFLTKYPFIHSDESWLSGLSRNYLETGSPIITETFFDLLPRFPHAIKIFFHYLQVFFIKLFGYNLFSVRLISLLFSVFSLYILYLLGKKILNSKKSSLILVALVSFDIHYIYTSHFARQEAIILFILILNFYLYLILKETSTKPVILGIITGLSIGIHPNSLFAAALIGACYLYDILIIKEKKIKNLLFFIITVGTFAVLFVLLSLYFDPNFFMNYKNFGDQFSVFAQPVSRISEIKNFYLKLFYKVSGTYYIPNIKFQLVLFPVLLLINIFKYLYYGKFSESKIIGILIFIITALNITFIVIGRYNQTSIVFIFPFFWILFILTFKNLKFKNILYHLTILTLLIISAINIIPYLNNDYEYYLKSISRYVDKDDTVLANLNSEFYFNNGSLYDYRNLHFLKDNNMSFSEYIEKNNIEYIIYPEEMDFIYNTRPVWNFIYGNLYYYYEGMHSYIDNNCRLVNTFNSPYGMRLSMYMYDKSWNIKIYKVN